MLRWNTTGITIAGGLGVSIATSLHFPYGLAFDSAKDLYVADYAHHRIVKIVGGTTVTAAGRADQVPGSAATESNLPVHMVFDSNDNLYIADRANGRIQLWAKSSTSGTTVAGMKKREKKCELRYRNLPKHRQLDQLFFLSPMNSLVHVDLYR